MKPRSLTVNIHLLRNMNCHVNQDEISNSILKLSAEVNKIESASGPSRRTFKMRREIEKLEDLLSYCKSRANPRAEQFHDIKTTNKS